MARTRSYELVVVLSPALEAEKVKGTLDRVHRLIQERGGTILKTEEWGLRRLAYPIRHLNEGVYHLTQFQTEASALQEIKGLLRLSEGVLRHLLVQVQG